MENQNKTKSKNIGEKSSEIQPDFSYTAIGILISSYKANGIHIANEEKYLELYEKEIQIAYNNGRASALSELSKG
jgi:hypothetical protein